MTRTLILAAGGLLVALVLSACGTQQVNVTAVRSRATPISFALSGTPSADEVGILTAQGDGNFTRAGLNVHLRTASSATQAFTDVKAGRVDVALASEPELMVARQAGATVLAFGALTQRPLDAILSLRSRHIRSLRDLRGRRIGTDGLAATQDLLDTVLTHAGVPVSSVRFVDVGSDPAGALTSGRVAAVFAGENDTATALRLAHHRVESLRLSTTQVPTYEPLVLVTTEDYFADHVNVLRRFVQALGRGYAAVRADPAAGARTLERAVPSLGAHVASASVAATLPSVFPSGGKPWGWQYTHDWNAFGQWLVTRHVLRNPEGWYEASTNQLLAGQGP